jgi:hypothetical protein
VAARSSDKALRAVMDASARPIELACGVVDEAVERAITE